MKKETGTPGNAPDTRERILQTASELFYREGTRAVGVDLIVAQAGVAKTSLYRHFATKDDLIEAFLLREDADFWAHWDAVAARYRRTPREELDAQLQWIGERIARPGYRGCPQINIAAEYADGNHPARKVAVAHKQELRRRLTELAGAMSVDEPETFALRLATVIDGALSSGQALHAHGPVAFLQEFAQLLSPKKGRKPAGLPR
ncbi:TetR family transcriptional regulator [Burkholderia cepacia]|uniref:TetR/AcrR family transcriptional regulator n=1 Tax=Burkholderia cepacia TaxID=292 RepID=UPI00075E5AB1|nr:TetR/AcrR family transcriptional regulator [Burkholderia cepacia]KVV61727.1 TetR family transcriptional regulator [Burkholderia cepacia]KVV68834.1 TetR family transcriptional regulator [Burkholderia cepacia]KVV69204.1 TetR family transcriptional regulator [Burkholderia cepacia]KVV89244.1 TetR family transcriptional regulator [Burkholderia cepacia]KVV93610.1 TetR family transcriptional regulator [Burkholderia cepacia]